MQMHSSLVLAFDATGCRHSVLLVGGKCLRYNKNTKTAETKTNSMTGPPPVLVVWGKVFEDLPSPAWSILGDSWPTFHCLRATILQFILEFLSFLCSRCILLHISTSIFQFPSDIVQLFRCLHASPSWPAGSNSSSGVRGSPFNCAIHTGSNFPHTIAWFGSYPSNECKQGYWDMRQNSFYINLYFDLIILHFTGWLLRGRNTLRRGVWVVRQ